MASRIEKLSAVSKGGIAAMGGAMALCLVGLGQATRPTPMPSALLFLSWVIAAGLIVVLSRVRLPHALKMGCIIAVLGVMFLLATQSDMFAMKRVSKKVGDAITSADGSSSDTSKDNAAPGGTGAAVHLRPSSEGDLGWARQLGDSLGGGVGGPSATWLSIDGIVSAREKDDRQVVMVAWTIEGAGKPAPCGTTSVIGRDEKAIAREVRESFEAATIRSNRQGRPACF